MNKGANALAIARACAEKKTPYFMQGIYGLVPYEAPGLGTMGVTENMVLVYDPEWTAKLPVEECAHTLIHEAIHIYFDHLARIQAANMKGKEANIAADLSVNSLMKEMGMLLPHGVYPEDYDLPNGQTIEWYYAQLTKNPNNNKKIEQLQKELQDKTSYGIAGDDPGNGDDATDKPAENKKNNGVGRGQCGGIAGNPINKEVEERADRECGRSKAEQQLVQKRMDAAVEQHIAQHGRGSLPASFESKINRAVEPPKVNWRQKLRHVALKVTGRVQSGGFDFSLALPSKSSFSTCIPRPGLVEQTPEVVFIIDTSGSMHNEQIRRGIREIIGVFKASGIEEAWLIQADADVAAAPKRVRLRDFMRELTIYGRGGTNFDPALQACMRLKPRPDIIFYITDGDGYLTFKPPIPTVWVVIRGHYNRKPADWGTIIFVEED